MSIARQHKAKVLADIEAGKVVVGRSSLGDAPTTNTVKGLAGAKKAGDLMLVALEDDLSTLSTIDDLAERAERKRVMLPKYLEYVAKYQASGARHPNPVLVYSVIWLLDIELVGEALTLATFAVEQQQLMPERFKRDLQTFVVESVVDWAERQYKAEHSPEPYLSQVIDLVESGQWVIAQIIVSGKMYKQAGLCAERDRRPVDALALYQKAMDVNSKAGVKGRIDGLIKKLETPE